ncbi:MAG: carbohydrate kinase, partial [Clostridia bacterium]|nr:carbohydrate kinase [Clostridia bacterium]
MKILTAHEKYRIRAAVFDFDGTLSTLRCGWESVMAPLMEEIIADGPATEDVRTRVRDYIDASTGIQTILQMKWIAEQVAAHGKTALDAWEYKEEYNRRLMQSVQKKKEALIAGEYAREDYLMAGSEA